MSKKTQGNYTGTGKLGENILHINSHLKNSSAQLPINLYDSTLVLNCGVFEEWFLEFLNIVPMS